MLDELSDISSPTPRYSFATEIDSHSEAEGGAAPAKYSFTEGARRVGGVAPWLAGDGPSSARSLAHGVLAQPRLGRCTDSEVELRSRLLVLQGKLRDSEREKEVRCTSSKPMPRVLSEV